MTNFSFGKGAFWLGAMLAVGAVISTAIAGDVVRDIKIRDRTISVKGYAIQPIRADVASWSGAFRVIQSGIEFVSYEPSFRFTKLENWKLKLLGLARENAKMRAEILIGGGGVEVGTVRSASQGVFQITRWSMSTISVSTKSG